MSPVLKFAQLWKVDSFEIFISCVSKTKSTQINYALWYNIA